MAEATVAYAEQPPPLPRQPIATAPSPGYIGLGWAEIIAVVAIVVGALVGALGLIFRLFVGITSRQADEAKARESAMAAKLNEREAALHGLTREVTQHTATTNGFLERLTVCAERQAPIVEEMARRLCEESDSDLHRALRPRREG